MKGCLLAMIQETRHLRLYNDVYLLKSEPLDFRVAPKSISKVDFDGKYTVTGRNNSEVSIDLSVSYPKLPKPNKVGLISALPVCKSS